MCYFEKLSVTIFFLFFAVFLSQNHRVTYEYKYIADTTDINNCSTEMMYLDILPTFSKFYSADNFKTDSIAKSHAEKNLHATGNVIGSPTPPIFKKNTTKYTVIKDYRKNELFYIVRMGRTKYKVKDRRNLAWVLHPDKDKFHTYSVQKATLNFGGRNWIAWFSTEIPLQDGPYKFAKLPGLILKMEDESKTHTYTFTAISNITAEESSTIKPTGNFVFDFGDNLEIDDEKYKKLYLDNRNDPAKSLRMTLHDTDKVNVDGVMTDKLQYIRERELQMREAIKKDNNPIEIDSIQK